MVAITATTYATPSVQSQQGRARLDQARREADQTEAAAQQLRAQAEQAEQDAQKSEARLRAASAALAQSDSTYSAQLRQSQSAARARQLQSALAPIVGAAGNQFAFPSNPLSRSSGQLLNQTA